MSFALTPSRLSAAVLLVLTIAPVGAAARERAIAVSTKTHHGCAITAAGKLMCWGNNAAGELGDGTTTTRLTPVNVVGLDEMVIAAATGDQHTCALMQSHAVKCWGANAHGQLGDGTKHNRSTPVAVQGLANISALAAGDNHTCALTANGGVKCWGDNAYGELGDATTQQRSAPIEVNGIASGAAGITAGDAYTCAMLTTGQVKCWGQNDHGQLGDGTTEQTPAPVDVLAKVSRQSIAAVDPLCTQAEYHPEGPFYRYQNICRYPVSTYVCVGTYDPFVGNDPPCDLTPDYNVHLRLDPQQTIDVAITPPSPGLREFNEMKECQRARVIPGGTLNNFPCNRAVLLTGIAAIAAGATHTCALTTSGGGKCWGDNAQGELGNGRRVDAATPVDIVGLTEVVADIAAGATQTCAVTTSGAAQCWGGNDHGQLGDRTRRPKRTPVGVVGLDSGVSDITAGVVSCAIAQPSGLTCWGENETGELGNGSTTEAHRPVRVKGF